MNRPIRLPHVSGLELHALERFVEENLEFSTIGLSTVSDLYESYRLAVSDIPGAAIPRIKFAPVLLHVCKERFKDNEDQIYLRRQDRQKIVSIVIGPKSKFSPLPVR